MKVNIDFNITILDGPEAGKSFKDSYIGETEPRLGFDGLLIEELIMKWAYMSPYQRMDDFKEAESEENNE